MISNTNTTNEYVTFAPPPLPSPHDRQYYSSYHVHLPNTLRPFAYVENPMHLMYSVGPQGPKMKEQRSRLTENRTFVTKIIKK